MKRTRSTETFVAEDGKATYSIVTGLLPEDVVMVLSKAYIYEKRTGTVPETQLNRDVHSYLVHGA